MVEQQPTTPPSNTQAIINKLLEVLPPSFVVLVVFLCIVFYHEGDMTAKRTEAIETILIACMQKH